MALLNSPGKKYNPKLILLGRCASRKGQAKCDHSKVPQYPSKFLWKPFAQLLTKVWKWVMLSHLSWWVTLHHHFLMILFSCPYPFVVPWGGQSRSTWQPGVLGFACAEQIPPDPCRHLLGTAVIMKTLKISHSTTFPGTARWKRKEQRSAGTVSRQGRNGKASPVQSGLVRGRGSGVCSRGVSVSAEMPWLQGQENQSCSQEKHH